MIEINYRAETNYQLLRIFMFNSFKRIRKQFIRFSFNSLI